MKIKIDSKPEVFIVESLRFSEEEQRCEGRIISEILQRSGKDCEYFYIRTNKELQAVIKRFAKSKFRYLHLSCHGDSNSLCTTLDDLNFSTLASIIKPHLSGRRLFISSCLATNEKIAKVLMKDSGCISILGPSRTIGFEDAAILWASLYHTLFSVDKARIKHSVLWRKAQDVANMFNVHLNYIRKTDNAKGFSMKALSPQPL